MRQVAGEEGGSWTEAGEGGRDPEHEGSGDAISRTLNFILRVM